MKRDYLVPILAIVPLIIIIYMLAELEYDMTPGLVGLLIVAYVAINVGYSVVKKTFHISMFVELALVSMIAYLVLVYLT
jgi:hypothetical protein